MNNETKRKLTALGIKELAEAIEIQEENTAKYLPLSFDDRLTLAVDYLYQAKYNEKIQRRIPQPLSVTRISVTPPFCISTVMRVAPASIPFSTSSFITEEGRSTTSPAAIRFATAKESTFIFPILLQPFLKIKQKRHGFVRR